MHGILPSPLESALPSNRPSPTASQSEPCPGLHFGVVLRESFEQAAQPLREHGRFEVQQLEPGSYEGSIDYARGRDTLVFREECPRKTFISGALAQGWFAICIPMGGSPATLGGQIIKDGLAPSAIGGEEIRLLTRAGYRHLVVLVNHARLQQIVEALGAGSKLMHAIESGRKGMALPIRHDAAWPLQRVLDKVATGHAEMDPTTFDELVYGTVLATIDSAEAPAGLPPSAILFRRALALANAQSGTPRVAELSVDLKVSPRTLHKAFQCVTGVGPAAFFLNRQLHAARQAIQTADAANSKVSAIAADLGITELGRFSVRYRRLFGESPSVTLRRTRQRTL